MADIALRPGQMRGMISAIAAISIFAFGLSLTYPLFSILLEEMGTSALLIGLNGSAAALAILIGGLALPQVLRHVALPKVMVWSVVAMAGLLLVFPLYPDPYLWLPLRFLFGMTTAALFVCSEIWIVSAAPPARRGLMIGIYGLFLSIGFLVGPLVLKVLGTGGWAPFIGGALVALCAIPPILFAWNDSPDLSEEVEVAPTLADTTRYFVTDPAIMGAVLLFGIIEFGAMSLFPVWTLRAGGDAQLALTLIALLAAGNVILQLPLGWVGDKFDRRKLLGLCAFATVIGSALFPLFSGTEWPLWITALIWGGTVVGLYTFALNELGARYSGAALARGTGAFTFAYGIGALMSPPALGAAIDFWPPHGMFGLLGVLAASYIVMLFVRPRRVPPTT